MQYWLIKSEPSEISIDDLQNMPDGTIEWFGIRNYQARNFMRDQMAIGDKILFWHSNCKVPGIYGIAEVAHASHPDSHQYDPNSKYFDPKSTSTKVIWWCVDVRFVAKTKVLSMSDLREHEELSTMKVLQRGNRLSITPVTSQEWQFIMGLLD